jgi:hypothetical protein
MSKILTAELIPVLQIAIGPVILISGVGLLLLTMTNRLGRAIDRARILASYTKKDRKDIEGQITILWLRARILRLAIQLASASALCSCLLVVSLFFTVLMKIEIAWLISSLFIGSMVFLVGALVLFLRDINKSLGALRIEIKLYRK